MQKGLFSVGMKKAAVTVMTMLTLALTGCSQKAVVQGPFFFPPEPNPPRIQYLMSIKDSSTVEDQPNALMLLLLGTSEAERMKRISKPYGVTTHKGKIYVADSGAANVVIIDLEHKSFDYLKGNANIGKLKKPINLALDREGNLYVADTVRKEILKYDAEGSFRGAFGKDLDMKPSDVLVDDDYIYALDIKQADIKVLDKRNGELIRTIGKGELNIPTNFAFGKNEQHIYVTNVGTGKVVILDKDGHLIKSFGELGDAFGQFSRPKGIAVDELGNIYVADSGFQNVQVFNENARLLIFFGDPPLPPGHGAMNLPAGVTVTTDNLAYFQKMAAPGFILERIIIVANQYGNDLISIYGLGEMKKEVSPANKGQSAQEAGDKKSEPAAAGNGQNTEDASKKDPAESKPGAGK